MLSKKYLFCLLLTALSCGVVHSATDDALCPTNQRCQDLGDSCQCYCSHKCGPRDKENDDAPVFVIDDKNENYCYCKPWDKKRVRRCKQEIKEAKKKHRHHKEMKVAGDLE